MTAVKHVWMEGYVVDDFYIVSGNVTLPDHGFEALIYDFRHLFATVVNMPADLVELKRVEISKPSEEETPSDEDTSVFIYMAIDNDEEDDFIDLLTDDDGEEDGEDDSAAAV